MHNEILIQCGACRGNLLADHEAISTEVPCPHCHKPVPVPHPEIKFSCEICQVPYECAQALGGELFDCAVCNSEFIVPMPGQEVVRRNGKLTTTPARNIHRVKETVADPTAVIVQDSSWHPPRIDYSSIPLVPILKLVGAVAVLVLLLNVVPSFFSPPPTRLAAPPPPPPLAPPTTSNAVAANAVVPTNTVDLTPWDGATDALRTLQAVAESSEALGRMDGFITSIGDTNLMVKAWMMRIWALSRLSQESTRSGAVGGLEFIRHEFPGTPLAEKTSLADYVDKCKTCNGEKKTTSQCPTCKGFERCPVCGGTGYIEEKTVSAPKKTTTTTQPAPETHPKIKIKRLGKDAPAIAPPAPSPSLAETPRRSTCDACGGGGRCATCGGAGSISKPCATCGAKGVIFSKDRVRVECLSAITTCLELIAKQKQDMVPLASGGQSDIAVRFHAACAHP